MAKGIFAVNFYLPFRRCSDLTLLGQKSFLIGPMFLMTYLPPRKRSIPLMPFFNFRSLEVLFTLTVVFFVKGFPALQGYHDFGPHDSWSQGDQVPGLFRGRLRFRLEWRDWSSQGARLLDSLGFFTFHFCESLEGGGDRPPGSSGCPKDRTDSSFFHHFCSLVLFEEAGFLTLPPLPQGCRSFDLFFLLSISFWCLSSSFPGIFL